MSDRNIAGVLFVAIVFAATSRQLTALEEATPVVQPSAEDKALAADMRTAAKAALGTPGQEPSNWLASGWQESLLPWLAGEKAATTAQLDLAMEKVKPVLDNTKKGTNWPVAGPIDIPYADKAPIIDGKLDDEAWKGCARFDSLYAFGKSQAEVGPATVWRVMWDEDNLYFFFDCRDTDIVAPKMARDDHVYFHDCVEMFILPEFRSGMYWELVVNPSGSIYDGLNAKRFSGWGALTRAELNIVGLRIGHQINGTANRSDDKDKGYTVEVAVPFKELPSYTRGNFPRAGQTLRFMLVRLDKNGEELKAYSFKPLLSWGHNIWNHATGVLTRKSE